MSKWRTIGLCLLYGPPAIAFLIGLGLVIFVTARDVVQNGDWILSLLALWIAVAIMALGFGVGIRGKERK